MASWIYINSPFFPLGSGLYTGPTVQGLSPSGASPVRPKKDGKVGTPFHFYTQSYILSESQNSNLH